MKTLRTATLRRTALLQSIRSSLAALRDKLARAGRVGATFLKLLIANLPKFVIGLPIVLLASPVNLLHALIIPMKALKDYITLIRAGRLPQETLTQRLKFLVKQLLPLFRSSLPLVVLTILTAVGTLLGLSVAKSILLVVPLHSIADFTKSLAEHLVTISIKRHDPHPGPQKDPLAKEIIRSYEDKYLALSDPQNSKDPVIQDLLYPPTPKLLPVPKLLPTVYATRLQVSLRPC